MLEIQVNKIWIKNKDEFKYKCHFLSSGSQTGESTLYDPNPESVWGPPRMFPPGEPKFPAKLKTPDQLIKRCSGCVDLKLEYNPNMEGPQTIFQCDTPLDFGESNTAAWPDSKLNQPVKLHTTNRCHLFCDKVSTNANAFSSIFDVAKAAYK